MSNRHYWPVEPGRYLMEAKSGERIFLRLLANGDWKNDYFTNAFDDREIRKHYLGVRTPFSEEAERAAFEAEYKRLFPNLRQPKFSGGMYGDYDHRMAFKIWLAAKRHERGL